MPLIFYVNHHAHQVTIKIHEIKIREMKVLVRGLHSRVYWVAVKRLKFMPEHRFNFWYKIKQRIPLFWTFILMQYKNGYKLKFILANKYKDIGQWIWDKLMPRADSLKKITGQSCSSVKDNWQIAWNLKWHSWML